MLKKIFIIVIVLIVIGLIGLGIFVYFDRQQGGNGAPLTIGGVNIGDFFPFGQGPSGTTTPNTSGGNGAGPNNSQNPQNQVPPPRLWKISNDPQSGAVAFIASSSDIVRFVDKATGNVFQSSLSLTGNDRVSNTTVPKVYEALWQNDGQSVVLRYLSSDAKTVKTGYGRLVDKKTTASVGSDDTSGPPQELKVEFLPDNIGNVAVNPATGALAYIIQDQTGSKVFVRAKNNTTPKDIIDSVIKDFSVSWIGSNVGLITKPSSIIPGNFYSLKADTGAIERVIGHKNGLTVSPSPDGKKILYSESTNSGLNLNIFDTKTGKDVPAPFSTLPEKCVWATKTTTVYCSVPKTLPSGQYPDDWYQGKITFNDAIWKTDTVTAATSMVIDPKIVVDIEIDGVNLSLDPTEKYLIFTNKKDAQLWGLKI